MKRLSKCLSSIVGGFLLFGLTAHAKEHNPSIEYAIILNGDNYFLSEKLHKANVDLAYEKLIDIGYKEENIFIKKTYDGYLDVLDSLEHQDNHHMSF